MLIVGGDATGIGIAVDAVPKVAALMAAELGHDAQWEKEQIAAFGKISRRYLPE